GERGPELGGGDGPVGEEEIVPRLGHHPGRVGERPGTVAHARRARPPCLTRVATGGTPSPPWYARGRGEARAQPGRDRNRAPRLDDSAPHMVDVGGRVGTQQLTIVGLKAPGGPGCWRQPRRC